MGVTSWQQEMLKVKSTSSWGDNPSAYVYDAVWATAIGLAAAKQAGLYNLHVLVILSSWCLVPPALLTTAVYWKH